MSDTDAKLYERLRCPAGTLLTNAACPRCGATADETCRMMPVPEPTKEAKS